MIWNSFSTSYTTSHAADSHLQILSLFPCSVCLRKKFFTLEEKCSLVCNAAGKFNCNNIFSDSVTVLASSSLRQHEKSLLVSKLEWIWNTASFLSKDQVLRSLSNTCGYLYYATHENMCYNTWTSHRENFLQVV